VSLSEATAAELSVEGDEITGRWKDAFQRVLANKAAVAGLVLIAIFVLVGVFAPLLAPYDPQAQDLSIIRPGVIPGPSADHWLGVDSLGRDLLSLIIGASLGLLLGGLAGGIGGTVDTVVMRITDMMLAVPGLLFAIGVAALLGRSLTTVMIAIGVVNIPVFARLLRGSMLAQRNSDYVLAARSIGVRPSRITLAHVVPNSIAPVLVQGTLALATAIIEAAGLAYLGLGANDPGIPEWGRMLAETQSYLQRGPHAAIFPGLAIVIACLGFNLLGDGLREALDPKFRR
jgi:peptide/nickel transport system permease protein